MPSDQKWSGGIIDIETYLKWKWYQIMPDAKVRTLFLKLPYNNIADIRKGSQNDAKLQK